MAVSVEAVACRDRGALPSVDDPPAVVGRVAVVVPEVVGRWTDAVSSFCSGASATAGGSGSVISPSCAVGGRGVGESNRESVEDSSRD